MLTHTHVGVDAAQVSEATGSASQIASELRTTELPTGEELAALRGVNR